MTNKELEARVEPLVAELQRLLVAHTDNLQRVDAELVKSLVLTMALADHSIDLGTTRLGRPPTLPEVVQHCMRAPFHRAAMYVVARRQRGNRPGWCA
jgi:hypothetical protein